MKVSSDDLQSLYVLLTIAKKYYNDLNQMAETERADSPLRMERDIVLQDIKDGEKAINNILNSKD